MAYARTNYLTKKALREAVTSGARVEVFQPGPFGPAVEDGVAFLEGPHYPKPHSWYAQVLVKDGVIVGKVK